MPYEPGSPLADDDAHRQHAGFAFGYHVAQGGCIVGFTVYCVPDRSGDLPPECGPVDDQPDGCLVIYFPSAPGRGGPRVRMLNGVALADALARKVAMSGPHSCVAGVHYFLGT